MVNYRTFIRALPNMARNRKANVNANDGPETYKMYGDLHISVQALLFDTSDLLFEFHPIDDDADAIESCNSNIMGRFTCSNNTCKKKGWGSKCIPIVIRLYERNRYNARVYYQRCAECDSLSEPELNERLKDSYTERVVCCLKRWSGEHVERPAYSRQSKGPHDQTRCEGCKAGHCRGLKKD
ncbi:3CxxC-type zinc finger protein [Aspergillus undulatus]|uniref:3CxxC-type zinc finger protein n=1 Tax=Aspergillus undulatus TaxID=1810928 RepID=UPI003CCD7E2F